jgi:hypothetical protein
MAVSYLSDFDVDVNGKTIHFERNKKLKPIDCILPWTEDYILEFKKCKESYQYFIEKYCRVLTEKGMQIVKLRKYQQKILDDFHNNRYNCLLAPRQCGKTTSIQLYLLWYILFSDQKKAAILAHKGRVARKILKDIKRSYEYIPHFLQQGIKIWNAGYIELENGCSIIADTTSKSGLSSESINILYIDEVALINQNLFWDFYDSNFPTLSSFKESKIFLTSTAKGLNHWYKIWTEAQQGKNGYNPIRVYWQEVPGRDEEWKKNEIAKTSELSFAQEQECSFLGSALTLIAGYKLSSLVFEDSKPIPEKLVHDRYNKFIKIYEMPKRDHVYVIGVDSSEMQEDSTSDSISLNVLDITTFPFEQVATVLIRDGINYLEIPEPTVEIAKFYNNAWLFIEGNSTGVEIANIIVNELDYENVYSEKGNLSVFKTTKKSKKLGCSNLKLLIENDRLIIRDYDTISQLSTFIKIGTSYKADKTYKDDVVMSLLAAIFFMQDSKFELLEGTEVDYLKGILKRDVEEEDEAPPLLVVLPIYSDVDEMPNVPPAEWNWLFQ